MNILIPMAGAGQRFVDAGYHTHKPLIPTTDWRTGKRIPMVIAATNDLPCIQHPGTKIIYVTRCFHKEHAIENQIKKFFPAAQFITVNHLTEGQASTCLLAKHLINNSEELLIAGCDNGMIFNIEDFLTKKQEADALIFTYRKHESVLIKPEAHGWVVTDEHNHVKSLSVKKAISNNPLDDHAIVATFWFKRGADFVRLAEKMISDNYRINQEFYVDAVMQYAVDSGLNIKVFEIKKYLGWGTPLDYENYENTIRYWKNFLMHEGIL